MGPARPTATAGKPAGRRETERSGRWFQGPGAAAGLEAGLGPPTARGDLIAPSARSGGHVVIVAARTAGDIAVDGLRGKPLPQLSRRAAAYRRGRSTRPRRPETPRRYPERGIEQVGIRRLHQRRGGARAVAFVAAEDVGEDFRFVGALATSLQLESAAAGAHLGRRGDENLHVGVGADHGADVAAVEHGAGRRRGELLLEFEQGRAHVRDRRDDRRRLADLVALERDLVEACGIDRLRRGNGARLVVGVVAGIEQRLRHRAVQQPGVEMAQAVVRGELLAERAFSRSRRSVDRDDHRRSGNPECPNAAARGWS